jgi:GT2 family glycosyltransferase
MRKNPKLSIVILSYNTKRLLKNCLLSLTKVADEVDFEVVIVDNASIDGSVEMVKRFINHNSGFKLLVNKINLGFARGNNCVRAVVKGKYILFLNSDTVVKKDTLKKTVEYLEKDKFLGALTCKILLPNGEFDKDTRRAFIDPWIGLTHLFLRLDRIFPRSKLFAKYWYGYLPEDKIHPVDVIQGAYFLVKKSILDKVSWFDDDYFLDGEDIDLCWKIKHAGYGIIYYPEVSIIHYKGSSKGKTESTRRKDVPLADKIRFRLSGVSSMELFFKKHLWIRYPLALDLFVVLGIYVMKIIRIVKTVVLG